MLDYLHALNQLSVNQSVSYDEMVDSSVGIGRAFINLILCIGMSTQKLFCTLQTG